MKRINIFLYLGIFCWGLLSAADLWDNTNGVPIRQGIAIEWQRTVCPGDNGSWIVIWSDTRYGHRNIFAQKVDETGTALWTEGGQAVTHLPGRQEDPVAIEDGDGGAFIAWVDYRFDEDGDIFYQHIDNAGNLLLDSTGIALCQIPGFQKTISMCTDSSGGVYVTWEDRRNGVDLDIYGTHINADDQVLDPGTGFPVVSTGGDQFAKSIEYGGGGQATIVWTDSRSGADLDVYLQRLRPDGSLVFVPTGLAVATSGDLESKPRTTYVRGDTSIVVWQIGETDPRLWYQFADSLNLQGTPQQVCSFASSQLDARVKQNARGEVAVLWKDLRFDPVDGDIFVQKILPDGTLAWTSEGLRLDASSQKKGFPRLNENDLGYTLVSWERGSYPEVDVIANLVRPGGTLVFGDTGRTISNLAGYQFAPILGHSGENGFYIAYADQGDGSTDLVVQTLDTTGTAGINGTGSILREGLDGDVKYVTGLTRADSVLLTWEDNRHGRILYGAAVASGGGEPERNGRALTGVPAVSEEVVTEPISVLGNDGLYLATFDASTGTKLIRLTKVSAQLDSLWNRDGVLIHETTADQRRPFLIPLDNGVVVFWSEIRNAIDFDIYFQVFSADGQRLGPVDGYPLAESYFVDEYVEWATLTPEGDLLVFWKEDTWGAGVLKAVRVTTAGQVVFGWPPTGLSVAGPTGNPDALRGKDLPGTGVLVVWEETRDQARDVYGQIFDWDGNPLLASQGMALTTAPNDQTNPSLAVNQTMGTALVVWEDFRDGLDFNLYGQLIDVQGFGLLDSNQVICDAEQYQLRPYVAALDEFGYGIVWEDERGSMAEDPVLTGGMDVYLNGFSDHLLFPSSGIPVIQEYHDQKNPQIHRLNHDEYLLIWQDLRSSGKADLVNLYGTVLQRTDLLESRNSTPLPGSFRLKPAYPNPFNGAVAIPVDIPSLQPLRLAIINLRGETVYSSLVLPQTVGNQVLRWEGKTVTGEPVPSGVYILEVDYGGTRYSGKLTYLK